MHTLKLNIQDNVFDKVIYFLNNLPKNDVEIIEDSIVLDDWSFLEKEIDKGIDSGASVKSHEELMIDLKQKYA